MFRQEGVGRSRVDRRKKVEFTEALDGLLDVGLRVAIVLGRRQQSLDLLVPEALEGCLALVAALGPNSEQKYQELWLWNRSF